MLAIRSIPEPIRLCFSLILLAIGGLVVNAVEITFGGFFLALSAKMIHDNLPFVQEHQSVLLPLFFAAIFLVLALPGFFTVIIMSRLASDNPIIGAIVLTLTGAFAWLGTLLCWAPYFAQQSLNANQALLVQVIDVSLLSNVVGQVLAAVLIGRAHSKKDS